MKINFKARLNNRIFLLSFSTLIVTFIYQVLGAFEIVPAISENETSELITMFVNILAFLGVLVDPTTEGLSDSERALTYYKENDVRMSEEVKK